MPALLRLLQQLLLLIAFLLPPSLRRRLLLRRFRPAQARCRAALQAPRDVRQQTLLAIIEANRRTEFGRAHGFDQIDSIAAFAARIPLRGYRELEPFILRHQRGEPGVLVAEALVGLARSGGSRGHPRPVPVTATSLAQWRWAEELLAAAAINMQPSVARGCVLHVLPSWPAASAPEVNAPRAVATLPLMPLAALAESLGVTGGLPSALPGALFTVEDEAARFRLMLRLAAQRPVTMLRAASPGTLTLLAEHLERYGPQLIEDIASGPPPMPQLPQLHRAIAQLRPNRARAARLRRCLLRSGRLEPRHLWPQLQLLVCSTDGPSRGAAERLADRFGSIRLLDPGYRAAEGIVTLPWHDAEGGPLALAGQFLELLPEGERTTIEPQELLAGQRVQIVVTGANGLYRYVLDDVMEVGEVRAGVAHLTLRGRARQRLRLASGLLAEEEVAEAIVTAARRRQLVLAGYTAWMHTSEERPATPPRRSWLARLLRREPVAAAPAARLTVAVEPTAAVTDTEASALSEVLDAELRRASRAYDEHRGKGALGAATLLVLRLGTFARRSHRRLAEGAADGHSPAPALADDEWLLDEGEVIQTVE
jgi:hypothetical protein